MTVIVIGVVVELQMRQVKKQLNDLQWQEQLLSCALFTVNMEMDGVQ